MMRVMLCAQRSTSICSVVIHRCWHGRCLHNRMLVESLWRIVLQKVCSHRLHQLDDLASGPVVVKYGNELIFELGMVQKSFEKTVVLFSECLDQVLQD